MAVLDTGRDLGHPDLQGAFVAGFDVVNQDADPSDDHGHGTMVTGVIAARSNNAVGVTSTCWRCSVMPVKVIGADGTGNASAVAEGIVWAADHGAQRDQHELHDERPRRRRRRRRSSTRARAGLSSWPPRETAARPTPTFPAAYPGVVSVAGTDAADGRYKWSSYGSWVRVAAPGCNLTTAPGGGYGEFCGTSSATAFLSGIVGLARSFAPETPTEGIEGAVTAGALSVGDFVSSGRIDAAAVLGALVPAAAATSAPGSTDEPTPARAARSLDLP